MVVASFAAEPPLTIDRPAPQRSHHAGLARLGRCLWLGCAFATPYLVFLWQTHFLLQTHAR
ncbi:hypothetical protein [Bosea sp. 685]|uniref:hypothetical protein n=1 Tax=Bosea sp. 685 TaxID=3080057 RepID=UPI002892B7F8|nr:hypothetical protein [Bosea sp. 685]WNJ92204.1 hypothetical protein RMR04_07880 [Bosea sp. 685]